MNYKSTKKYKDIKNSLLQQLIENGNDTPFFRDLVDDYMALYVTKEMLIEDIYERGVIQRYQHGANQGGVQDNKSIKQLTSVNLQMLKLLNQLGIKANVPKEEKAKEKEAESDEL